MKNSESIKVLTGQWVSQLEANLLANSMTEKQYHDCLSHGRRINFNGVGYFVTTYATIDRYHSIKVELWEIVNSY